MTSMYSRSFNIRCTSARSVDVINCTAAIGQARLSQSALHRRGDCLVARKRLAAAAKHDRIPCLDADGGDVARHVGTGFVNNPDDSERHTPLGHHEPVRPGHHVEPLANGICQRSQLPPHRAPSRQSVRVSAAGDRFRCAARHSHSPVRLPRGSPARARESRRPSPGARGSSAPCPACASTNRRSFRRRGFLDQLVSGHRHFQSITTLFR